MGCNMSLEALDADLESRGQHTVTVKTVGIDGCGGVLRVPCRVKQV